MRISDWSSDVCSSDLVDPGNAVEIVKVQRHQQIAARNDGDGDGDQAEPADQKQQHGIEQDTEQVEIQHEPRPAQGAKQKFDQGGDGELEDRKRLGSGTSVSVRVALGGGRIIKKKI